MTLNGQELKAAFEDHGVRFNLPNGSSALIYSQYRKDGQPCTLITSQVRPSDNQDGHAAMLEMRWENKNGPVHDAHGVVETDRRGQRDHAILEREERGDNEVKLEHWRPFGGELDCDYRLELSKGEYPCHYQLQADHGSYMGYALEKDDAEHLTRSQQLADQTVAEYYLR